MLPIITLTIAFICWLFNGILKKGTEKPHFVGLNLGCLAVKVQVNLAIAHLYKL